MSEQVYAKEAIFVAIAIASAIFLVISTTMVFFVIMFQKKKLKHEQEKAFLSIYFEQEILKSQIEVQNFTLRQISQEIHDNVGQLLSVAKINLNVLEEIHQPAENLVYIKQTNEILEQSIQELRTLTKSLDSDFIQDFGLQQSVTHELLRIENTKKFKTSISINGDPYTLGYDREIVLFRIIQEVLTNALKHSKARHIALTLIYQPDVFRIIIIDDGQGFDFSTKLASTNQEIRNSGSGLRNIQRRCNLINFDCKVDSKIGEGTSFFLQTTRDLVVQEKR